MNFVVEGKVLEVIANEMSPKLDELVEKFGYLETLSAMTLLVKLHLGEENAKAALEGIRTDNYSLVPKAS